MSKMICEVHIGSHPGLATGSNHYLHSERMCRALTKVE